MRAGRHQQKNEIPSTPNISNLGQQKNIKEIGEVSN